MSSTRKHFAVIAILLQILVCSTHKTAVGGDGFYGEEFYYWQKFNGFIPQTAVPGGTTVLNETTYIGSTMFYEFNSEWAFPVYPSTIYENDKFTYAVHNHSECKTYVKKHTYILCAIRPPTWVTVDIANIPKTCYPILGGHEKLTPLYIGRMRTKKVYHIGKVFYPTGLVTVHGGKERHDKTFELLAYCR